MKTKNGLNKKRILKLSLKKKLSFFNPDIKWNQQKSLFHHSINVCTSHSWSRIQYIVWFYGGVRALEVVLASCPVRPHIKLYFIDLLSQSFEIPNIFFCWKNHTIWNRTEYKIKQKSKLHIKIDHTWYHSFNIGHFRCWTPNVGIVKYRIGKTRSSEIALSPHYR